MMSGYKWIGVLLLSVFALTAGGCLAVAAAAGAGGTVAYMGGDLEATVEAGPREVVAAAESALNNMDIHIISSSADESAGEIKARNAQDKKITIKVERQSDTLSHLSVRVGMFGDEELSRTIYERIQDNL